MKKIRSGTSRIRRQVDVGAVKKKPVVEQAKGAVSEPEVDLEARTIDKPSKAAAAVLGQVETKRTRKKSAAARAALQGVERQRGTPAWKKAVLAAVMGITLFNVTAPAMAQAAEMVNPPTQVEQTVPADAGAMNLQTFNPLSLRYQSPDDMDFGAHLEHTADSLNESQQLIGEPVELGAGHSVEEVTEQAFENFDIRLRRALDQDAVSLAHGETPWQPGDALSDHQQDRVMDALSDLFGDLPLGAMSDSVSGPIKAFLSNNGVDTSNVDGMRLSDLGGPAGEAAKNLAQQLRDDHPATFYGLAGAAGAGLIAHGYLNGSDALEDLGIKPEVSANLFGNVGVEVQGEWGPKFDNAGVSVLGTYDFGQHEVGAGGRYMDGEFAPQLSYDFRSDTVRSEVDLTFGSDVEVDARLQVNVDHTFSAGARLQLNDPDGGADFATLGARYRVDDHSTFGLDAGMNFDTDSFQGNLSYDYRTNDNLHLHVQGGYNEALGANVGVGVTFNW